MQLLRKFFWLIVVVIPDLFFYGSLFPILFDYQKHSKFFFFSASPFFLIFLMIKKYLCCSYAFLCSCVFQLLFFRSSRVECILGRFLCNAGRKFEYFMHKMQNHNTTQSAVHTKICWWFLESLVKEGKKSKVSREQKMNFAYGSEAAQYRPIVWFYDRFFLFRLRKYWRNVWVLDHIRRQTHCIASSSSLSLKIARLKWKREIKKEIR